MVLLKCIPNTAGEVYYIPANKLVAYFVDSSGVVKISAPYPNGSIGFTTRTFDGSEADLLLLLEQV